MTTMEPKSVGGRYLLEVWNGIKKYIRKDKVEKKFQTIVKPAIEDIDKFEGQRFWDIGQREMLLVRCKISILSVLWERYGVCMYYAEYPNYLIDIHPSFVTARVIARALGSQGFDCRLSYMAEPAYWYPWYKIEVNLRNLYFFEQIQDIHNLLQVVTEALCSTLIESGNVVQRCMKNALAKKKAAIVIQSAFRGWKTRMNTTWNLNHPYGKHVLTKMIMEWCADDSLL